MALGAEAHRTAGCSYITRVLHADLGDGRQGLWHEVIDNNVVHDTQALRLRGRLLRPEPRSGASQRQTSSNGQNWS